MTTYYLWLDNTIIGIFTVIHELNEHQRERDGHIAYAVLREYRGKGYASEGLRLVIEDAKNYIKEDEIYLHTTRDNQASLKVMLNNGAYIAKENEFEYFTRIKIK
jgi:predicted acetyltransferase